MKKVVIIIALSLCTTACDEGDTETANLWRRTVEPRLSVTTEWQPCRPVPLGPGRLLEEPQCDGRVQARTQDCEAPVVTHAAALQMLTAQPSCTDAAVAALERFAESTGTWSDLAAAYFLRAHRDDRPSDLLSALDAARRAATAEPGSAAARFNLALIQEALGFSSDAISSWNEVVRAADPAWSDEARQRRDRLRAREASSAAIQWPRSREQLTAALAARDRAAVARLIGRFPSQSMDVLIEDLLPQWADSQSGEDLERGALLAAEWSRLTGDRFAVDVVDAIAHSKDIASVQQGYAAFRAARSHERAFRWKDAASAYDGARTSFERGETPLHLLATVGSAVASSFEPDGTTPALAMLETVEGAALERGFVHLLARTRFTRGGLLFNESRFVEALGTYDAAIDAYVRLRDPGNIASIRSRKSGVYWTAGQDELAWREAFAALRDLPHIVDLKSRNVVLGEAATVSLRLGHARTALLYQAAAVRLIQSEIAATSPERLDRVDYLQQNLAVALRARAGIELHLEGFDSALADLTEAARLSIDRRDHDNRRALQARIHEIEGEVFLRLNPRRAITAFTNALSHAASDEHRTFRAAQYARRAEANRRLGRPVEAERDLLSALHELREEEIRILRQRERGQGEEIWSAYFSRFDDAYELLVRHYADQNRPAEAFRYSEKPRAVELLDLVRQLESAPDAFRRLQGEPMDLATIQQSLPEGTFLIQYSVLEDRTYAWVISRRSMAMRTLSARRRDVDRWSADLRRAVRQKSAQAFEQAVYAPFAGLIAEPLTAVGAAPARLVFVPDGSMHGLPFAALRDPVTRRHLVRYAPLEIAGSATLYVLSLQRDRALHVITRPAALLVGDPKFDERLPFASGMSRLSGARREVEEIRRFYDDPAVLFDEEATVPEFLALARKSNVLHFAGHAIANVRTPSRSMLLLAPSPAHTGALEARELLTRLSLDQTRLVVLGACSSAGGLPIGPEGVAPLVRPLIAAGVPAVIGTLWDIDDATAKEVLVSFHRHYRDGGDAAVALQAAQIELLNEKNAGLRSALTWAPYQVIGHTSSPAAPRVTQGKEKPP